MTDRDPPPADRPRVSLSGFADYLAAQRSEITDQWLLLVRRDPRIETADRLPQHQLIDHIPRILKELCDFLRTRNAVNLFGEARRDAQNHGELRWQDGYRIDELLRELEALRHIVASSAFRYRDQDAGFKGSLEVSANVLVHQFFAEISVASIRQFMREQGNVARSTVQQLTSAHQELGRENTRLEHALSEQVRATGMVAHEIRDFLQAMPAELEHPADRRVHDLRGFLNQLLEYTELMGKRPALEHVPFKPAELFAEIVATHEPLARKKGLQWHADARTAPERVAGDPSATKRIADILLSNAIAITSRGGITLTFSAHDSGQWTIRVEDTGPGMSSEASAQLFSAAGAAAKNRLPVPGFGLAIAKDLISRLGGTLHAMTQSDTGTQIDVTLPTNT